MHFRRKLPDHLCDEDSLALRSETWTFFVERDQEASEQKSVKVLNTPLRQHPPVCTEVE